ncbi:ComEC/Rec2 family competence protein [Sinomonas humi]|uniref:ComEC/Rec2 family competence protein n=1 Tax=Sinomonas humi TaxID=1338436 RepID=UPI0018CF0298|nr:ComEC/Rec2 family competence protein [Sinomonas humi]
MTAVSGSVGFIAGAARLSADTAGPAGTLISEGGAAMASLEILSEPRRQAVTARFATGPRYMTDARLLAAVRDGQRFSASARVILAGGEYLRGLAAGTRVEVAVRVSPRGPGTAFVTAQGSPREIAPPAAAAGWRASAREGLRTHSAWLPANAAGLVPALAVGDRSRLDPQLEGAMSVAGLTHLTAVSGANFAIVVGTVVLFLRALRLPRKVVHGVSGVVLVCFVGIVGPEPSVLRAGAMGVVSLMALASGRTGAGSAALSAAIIAVVLADPALALSFGFALSVLATLGITLIARPLATRLSARLPAWLAAAVAVPLSAQLLCGPVVVLLEPSFQTWSLAANLAVAPLVPPITVGATLALAAGPLCAPIALVATAFAGLPAELLAGAAHAFAGLPGARLPWAGGPVGSVGMALVSLATAALVCGLGHRRRAARTPPT